MGGNISKGRSRHDSSQEVDVSGDIFNDLLKSDQFTDSKRREKLILAKKLWPASYRKRFGTKSIDEILRERMPSNMFHFDGSSETGRQLVQLLADVMGSKGLSKKKKLAFLGRFETAHPGITEELKRSSRMKQEAKVEMPDPGHGRESIESNIAYVGESPGADPAAGSESSGEGRDTVWWSASDESDSD